MNGRQRGDPLKPGVVSPPLMVPSHIGRPPYADTGVLPEFKSDVLEIHDEVVRHMVKIVSSQFRYLENELIGFNCTLVILGNTKDASIMQAGCTGFGICWHLGKTWNYH